MCVCVCDAGCLEKSKVSNSIVCRQSRAAVRETTSIRTSPSPSPLPSQSLLWLLLWVCFTCSSCFAYFILVSLTLCALFGRGAGTFRVCLSDFITSKVALVFFSAAQTSTLNPCASWGRGSMCVCECVCVHFVCCFCHLLVSPVA